MKTRIKVLGNTLAYPELNVLILKKDGGRFLLRPYIFELNLLSSLLFASYCAYKLLGKVSGILKRLFLKLKPMMLKANNLALIFGFGDSLASVKVTKGLLSLGFDLILINKKDSLEHRAEYFLNKNEHIEEVDNKGMCVSYEEILEKPQILKDKINQRKIDYIIDFTSFRITIDTGKIIKENEELLNKSFGEIENSDNNNFNNKERQENDLTEKEKENLIKVITDKKAETSIGSFGSTNLQKKLNQSALQYYNSKIFYSEEISKHVNEVILITESLIPFLDETKILIFNYKDKDNDVNHKLIVDLKKIFFENLQTLSEKKGIIKYVKKINGLINYKFKQFTEEDGIKIIKYGESSSFEYSFL